VLQSWNDISAAQVDQAASSRAWLTRRRPVAAGYTRSSTTCTECTPASMAA